MNYYVWLNFCNCMFNIKVMTDEQYWDLRYKIWRI